MNDIKVAIEILKRYEKVCELMPGHEDEAEAFQLAINELEEKERHRRSWEELLAEERIDG